MLAWVLGLWQGYDKHGHMHQDCKQHLVDQKSQIETISPNYDLEPISSTNALTRQTPEFDALLPMIA